jgi:hypothetical protein
VKDAEPRWQRSEMAAPAHYVKSQATRWYKWDSFMAAAYGLLSSSFGQS